MINQGVYRNLIHLHVVTESFSSLNVTWPQSQLWLGQCVCVFIPGQRLFRPFSAIALVSIPASMCKICGLWLCQYENGCLQNTLKIHLKVTTIFIFIIDWYMERVVFWCHNKTNKIDIFSAELNSQSQPSFCFLSCHQRVMVKGAQHHVITDMVTVLS